MCRRSQHTLLAINHPLERARARASRERGARSAGAGARRGRCAPELRDGGGNALGRPPRCVCATAALLRPRAPRVLGGACDARVGTLHAPRRSRAHPTLLQLILATMSPLRGPEDAKRQRAATCAHHARRAHARRAERGVRAHAPAIPRVLVAALRRRAVVVAAAAAPVATTLGAAQAQRAPQHFRRERAGSARRRGRARAPQGTAQAGGGEVDGQEGRGGGEVGRGLVGAWGWAREAREGGAASRCGAAPLSRPPRVGRLPCEIPIK